MYVVLSLVEVIILERMNRRVVPAEYLCLTVSFSFEFVEICCSDHENQGPTNNSPYLQFRKNGLHRSKKVGWCFLLFCFAFLSSKVIQLTKSLV